MIEVTRRTIDTAALLAYVTKPECGAEVLFVGTTRQWTGDQETLVLEYDGYVEMATKLLESLETQARQRWDISEVAICHRLGHVEVGQASVAVAVGAAHRDHAFAAARWLIDELKQHVPIWKCDHGPSQSAWVHPT